MIHPWSTEESGTIHPYSDPLTQMYTHYKLALHFYPAVWIPESITLTTDYLSAYFCFLHLLSFPLETLSFNNLSLYLPLLSQFLCGEWPSNARIINHSWRCSPLPSPLLLLFFLLHPAVLLSLAVLLYWWPHHHTHRHAHIGTHRRATKRSVNQLFFLAPCYTSLDYLKRCIMDQTWEAAASPQLQYNHIRQSPDRS